MKKKLNFSGKLKQMAFSKRSAEPSSSNPSPETPSHFFKVILPATLQDNKLRIPKKFVRKFGDELSAVAKLTVPHGHAWQVGLTKDGEKMWFDDGWHDFVSYFSIRAGYFLVFGYGKNSNFCVLIFDTTACEIQYPYTCRGPKTDVRNFVHHDEMGERTNEREMEIDAASAFEPSNPFCRVVMRPSYLRSRSMYLPSCFSQKHLKGVSGFIKLQLSDGKQWSVRCLYTTQHRAILSQGWRGFIFDNNLGEGDVCVFELLGSRDVVLKVTLFRVLESAEFVDQPSFGSALRSNRSQKCAASPKNPKFKHCIDMRSKRCKIEELDDSELIKARDKVEAHSSDEENGRTEFHELDLLALLEDMGIYISRNVRHIAAEGRERVTTAAGLFKPKNPSFMIILQLDHLKSHRVAVPTKFAKKCLSRDSKCIKVQDSSGREWPGVTMWYGNHAVIRSLAGLLREMNLGEGDICIFELIKVDELFKVSVFYAAT